MNNTNRYRDENFERYIEQVELALDEQLFSLSPVVAAVKRLHSRLSTHRGTKSRRLAGTSQGR